MEKNKKAEMLLIIIMQTSRCQKTPKSGVRQKSVKSDKKLFSIYKYNVKSWNLKNMS